MDRYSYNLNEEEIPKKWYNLDLSSYDKFYDGHLKDYAYPMTKIKKALKDLPAV